MKQPDQCENMEDIREAIDVIDRNIIECLAFRNEYVKAASTFKKSADSVVAKKRKEQVFKQRREWAEENNLPPDLIEKVYKMLVEYFVSEEMEHWKNSGS